MLERYTEALTDAQLQQAFARLAETEGFALLKNEDAVFDLTQSTVPSLEAFDIDANALVSFASRAAGDAEALTAAGTALLPDLRAAAASAKTLLYVSEARGAYDVEEDWDRCFFAGYDVHGASCGVHVGSLSAGHGDLSARLEIFNGFLAVAAPDPSLRAVLGGDGGISLVADRPVRVFTSDFGRTVRELIDAGEIVVSGYLCNMLQQQLEGFEIYAAGLEQVGAAIGRLARAHRERCDLVGFEAGCLGRECGRVREILKRLEADRWTVSFCARSRYTMGNAFEALQAHPQLLLPLCRIRPKGAVGVTVSLVKTGKDRYLKFESPPPSTPQARALDQFMEGIVP